jgi:hypothetical protein
MAIVRAKPRGETRPRHATDNYSQFLRKYSSRQIDPSMFPTGGLGGLGDAGDTGIALVDDVHHQIDDAAVAAKVTAGFAIAAGVFSALSYNFLWQARRR